MYFGRNRLNVFAKANFKADSDMGFATLNVELIVSMLT